MKRNRYAQQRPQRASASLERRMDQWVETGRQFVDGVSGNRPGQRRKDNRNGLNNMGRWVEDKIDWFFEEEDQDWSSSKSVSNNNSDDDVSLRKRPLTAISLRVPKSLSPSSLDNNASNANNEWPDDSDFRVDRWERDSHSVQQVKTTTQLTDFSNKKISNSNRRPLPRSSRRRN